MKDFIAKAVAIMRSSPLTDDVEIRRSLITDGLDVSVASRLLDFVPMAYCRLMLEPSGVRFSAHFRQALANNQVSTEQPLLSDPTWLEVLSFARSEIHAGVSRDDILALAGRSAEFDAINRLMNNGSNLKDLVLSSPILTRTEDDSAES